MQNVGFQFSSICSICPREIMRSLPNTLCIRVCVYNIYMYTYIYIYIYIYTRAHARMHRVSGNNRIISREQIYIYSVLKNLGKFLYRTDRVN